MDDSLQRIDWAGRRNAVELGFDYYLGLLERRLKGEDVSLVQELRGFFKEHVGVDLRETQARGLMHKSSSVFIDYVRDISGETFVPGIQHWQSLGLERFKEWEQSFYKKRDTVAVDVEAEEQEIDDFQEQFREKADTVPGRKKVVVTRILRDTALSRFLKSLYYHRCQICAFSFRLPNGNKYAESHHLRPLGKRHGGIDNQSNILVLCPNHHAMFDYGVIAIHPEKLILLSIDRNIREADQSLRLLRHGVDREFLEYHVSNIFNKVV